MTDRAAGERLKRAIHIARAKANILYDTDLAGRAGVSYDTLMNWYGGKTVPRGAELRRLALALGVTYADLMAAYEGVDPEPPALTDVLRELVDELRLTRAQQHESTLALLKAVGASSGPGRSPRGTSGDTQPEDAVRTGQDART